jgi:4-fold beta-flower domain-containing protein
MGNYIYTNSGTPAAFHHGDLIYDLHGRAVAKLLGSQVYCMAGHYVGELGDGVIVVKEPKLREHSRTRGRQRGTPPNGLARGTRNPLSRHLGKTLRGNK